MFPQRERVSKETFAAVLKDGRSVHSDNLSLRYMEIRGFSGVSKNKYTFVVSSKVSKSAVIRNLLKRRGRHIVAKINDKIKTPYACAFFFKPGSANLDFDKIEKEIIILLSRAKLI